VAERYAADRHVTVDEATRRLAIQDRANGLSVELREALGGAYAGTWFDEDDGNVVAATTDQAATEQAITEVLDRHGLEDDGTIVEVPSSRQDLEAAQADLDLLVTRRFGRGHAWTAIDLVRNRVVVGIGKDATADERALLDARRAAWAKGVADAPAGTPFPPVGDRDAAGRTRTVTIVLDELGGSAVAPPTGCSTTYKTCDPPLRGGTYMDDTHHACSVGYLGYWVNAGTKNPYAITAGHCMVGGSNHSWSAYDPVAGSTYVLGSPGTWRFGSSIGTSAPAVNRDIGIIQVPYTSHWTNTLAGWIAMWGWATSGWSTWQLTSQDIAVPGEYGCRTGASSNFTCGTVLYQSQTITVGPTDTGQYGDIGNMFSVTGACGIPGDSGGPFVDGGKALGIASAGSCAGGPFYYQHVYDAGAYFGVWVWL